MSRIRPSNEIGLKVYILLSEGKVAAQAARLLQVSRSLVSYHVSRLVAQGFLYEESRGRETFYRKGPESDKLDAIIVQKSVQIDARGVTNCSKSVQDVPTAKVHHFKFKLHVLKRGDLELIREQREDGSILTRPFLKLYFDYHNVKRWKGYLPYADGQVTVEFEETPSAETLYLYPPPMDLTANEIEAGEDDKRAVESCLKLAAYLQSHAGWKLGIPEDTDWQRHYGIDDPEGMGRIAQKYFVRASDGKAWTSNSEGKDEYETSDALLAQIKLTLPDRVITLSAKVETLAEDFRKIAEALESIRRGMSSETEILAVMAGRSIETTIQKVEASKSAEASCFQSSVSQDTPRTKDKYEVDYVN